MADRHDPGPGRIEDYALLSEQPVLVAEVHDGEAGRNVPPTLSHPALVNSAAILFGETARRRP
ncbi:MAG TPA: hypothetical protein VGD48_21345 [Kutzneria sp.]